MTGIWLGSIGMFMIGMSAVVVALVQSIELVLHAHERPRCTCKDDHVDKLMAQRRADKMGEA